MKKFKRFCIIKKQQAGKGEKVAELVDFVFPQRQRLQPRLADKASIAL